MKVILFVYIILFSLIGISQPVKSPIIFKLMGHSDDLQCMAISGNGKYIASGSWDGIVNLFLTDSNYTPIGTFSDHFSAVNSIEFTNNGKMLVTAGSDGKVFTYKIDSLDIITKDKSAALHRMSINCVYVDPGGKFVFTGSNDGTIIQYELLKNKERKITNNNPVVSIAVGRDKKTIYCADNTNTIKKYDILNPNIPVISFIGHTDQVNQVLLSKDNTYLLSASSDKSINIWNTVTKKLEKTLTGHDWKVISLALSSDGKYIASGSNDGSIKMWEFETGKEIRSFDNIGSNVKGVAFSLDNSVIYASMSYPLDSFETIGVLAFHTGIKKQQKVPPKNPSQPKIPIAKPKNSKEAPQPKEVSKEIIKKTDEIEISEEKKKLP